MAKGNSPSGSDERPLPGDPGATLARGGIADTGAGKDFVCLSKRLLAAGDDPATVFLDEAQTRATTATRFFRNAHLLEATRTAVSSYFTKRLTGPLTMWSCGCSSGEELYSMAMIALEEMTRHTVWRRLRAYGTDINPHLVQEARIGKYRRPGQATMNAECWRLMNKYAMIGNHEVQMGNTLQNVCSFTHFDIRKKPRRHTFHFIVCNHVLQYYDATGQRHIVDNLRAVLQENGMVYLEGVPEHIVLGEMGLRKVANCPKLYQASE